MNRPGRFFFSKKGGGLILLALTVFGGGWLYSQGRSGDGRLTPFFSPRPLTLYPSGKYPEPGLEK